MLAGAARVWAGGASDSVRNILDKAMEIQTRPDLEGEEHKADRARLVRQIISDNFLTSEMAMDAVRDSWGKASPKQRTEFSDLFKSLFQESYTRMVLNFLKKETIEYPGEEPERNGMQVKTVIMRANEHIPVDYYVVQKGARWMIEDVVIDGVSIVDNYKGSFSHVVQAESFEGLLKRMRLQSRTEQEEVGR
jgi:phospholipid transport system substrate-binding protein